MTYRSFVKNNATVIAGHAFVYMRGLLVMPIVIKSVGVTTYGGYVLLVSLLSIAFWLAPLGAGVTSRRYLPSAATMEERRQRFYPQLTFALLMIVTAGAALGTLAYPFLRDRGILFSRWAPGVYLLAYLAYSQATDYLRYTGRVQYMTLANLCYPYLDILLVLVFLYAFRTLSINMLVLSTSVAGVMVAAPIVFVIVRELGARLAFYSREGFVTDIRLGLPLVLNNILDFTLAVSDRYLIALYLSVTAVGYYVPAYTLGSLIIFIPKAIGTAFPQLLALAVDRGRQHEAETMFDYTIKLFLLLAIPYVFGCAVLGRTVLTLLANEDVASRGRLIAPVVALATLFYGLTLLQANALFIRLKTRTMFQVNLIAGITNVAANLVLLFVFRDIQVAAFTTLLAYVIAFIYGSIAVAPEWRADYSLPTIAKAIAASAVMAVVVSLAVARIPAAPIVTVAAFGSLGVVTYAACLLALRTFTDREILFLRELYGSR